MPPAPAFVASNFLAAATYFRRFAHEPTSATTEALIGTVTVVEVSAASLFAAMSTGCRPGGEAVVAAHSLPEGVALPLGTHHGAALHQEVVNSLTMIVRATGPARTTAIAQMVTDAHDPQISAASLGAMIGSLEAVRALGLAAVHFRGCRLGSSSSTMQSLRRLPGCARVTALDVRSLFSTLSPRVLAGSDSQRRQEFDSHVGHGFADNVDGTSPNRFGFSTILTETPDHAEVSFPDCVAESASATAEWIRRHLPPPAPAYTSGAAPMHAAINVGRLIFPFNAQGQVNPDYATRVTSVTAGDD